MLAFLIFPGPFVSGISPSEVKQLTLKDISKLLKRLGQIGKKSDIDDSDNEGEIPDIQKMQQEYLASLTPEQLAKVKEKYGK